MTTDNPGPSLDGMLTLTQAAARTGHTREAIRQRVRRGSLPVTKGNDGVLMVNVRDLADLPPPDATTDNQGRPGDAGKPMTGIDHPMSTDDPWTTTDATMDDLRTALVKAQADHLVDRGRAERAEALLADLTARTTLVAARLVTVEAERDQARQQREDARVRAAGAEGEAKALREALYDSRRPAWRRWLGWE